MGQHFNIFGTLNFWQICMTINWHFIATVQWKNKEQSFLNVNLFWSFYMTIPSLYPNNLFIFIPFGLINGILYNNFQIMRTNLQIIRLIDQQKRSISNCFFFEQRITSTPKWFVMSNIQWDFFIWLFSIINIASNEDILCTWGCYVLLTVFFCIS